MVLFNTWLYKRVTKFLCFVITRYNKRPRLLVSHNVHPQTLSVVQTRADSLGLAVDVADISQADFSSRQYAGVLFQYPDTSGDLCDFTDIVQRAHAEGVSVVFFTSIISCKHRFNCSANLFY